MIDLTDRLLELYPIKEGKVGRYSVSSLWGMLTNNREGIPYTTPEQYIKGEVIDFKSAMRMWNGTWSHAKIQQLLPEYEHEKKVEFEIDDIIVVGKADAINDQEILEIKTSEQVLTKSKSWHDYQLRWYLTLFKREKGRIVQPVKTSTKIWLEVIGEIKRNDTWVQKEIDKLKQYHKLCQQLKK